MIIMVELMWLINPRTALYEWTGIEVDTRISLTGRRHDITSSGVDKGVAIIPLSSSEQRTSNHDWPISFDAKLSALHNGRWKFIVDHEYAMQKQWWIMTFFLFKRWHTGLVLLYGTLLLSALHPRDIGEKAKIGFVSYPNSSSWSSFVFEWLRWNLLFPWF